MENNKNVIVNANYHVYASSDLLRLYLIILETHKGVNTVWPKKLPDTKCILMPGVYEAIMLLCYLTPMPVVSVHECTHSINFYSRL